MDFTGRIIAAAYIQSEIKNISAFLILFARQQKECLRGERDNKKYDSGRGENCDRF